MARQIWGCYSVADHLERRAFVADLLLYDRLVVPIPSADDLGRWEKWWGPDRQTRLLDILGPFAERMVWSPGLREQFEREWSPADLAFDIDAENSDAAASTAGPESLAGPYGVTRRIISQELGKKVFDERGDVRAIARTKFAGSPVPIVPALQPTVQGPTKPSAKVCLQMEHPRLLAMRAGNELLLPQPRAFASLKQ